MSNPHYSLTMPEFGEFRIAPLRIPEDINALHLWVNQDYAKFWGLLPSSVEKVTETYRSLIASGHTKAYMGFYNHHPAFLLETYDPKHSPLEAESPAETGDLGMHILIAPPSQIISHFTATVFQVIMEFMFSDPAVQRIVVEPDHRNDKIHRLNKQVGFQHTRQIKLGDKTAFLAFCSREDFANARALDLKHRGEPDPEGLLQALNPIVWAQVNRLLIRKSISELAHELVFKPEQIGADEDWGQYQLKTDCGAIRYRFRAILLSLDHWHIDAASISKTSRDEVVGLDALSFIMEFREVLGIPADKMPIYLEEITSTLLSAAFKRTKSSPTSAELLTASFQEIEQAMMEGHPSFIANNGRIGFDAQDFQRYAPEAASGIHLIWVAAHRDYATFSSVTDWDYERLLAQELDLSTRASFHQLLVSRGLDPEQYLFMPVHPWQWTNKIASVFAGEIAAERLIYLGVSDGTYLPQQSIRTLFNLSQPKHCYVKTALSILNMGFMRGLSAHYMRTTPAINDWVQNLVAGDAYLQKKGFAILREIAAVGYRNPYYEREGIEAGAYKKMLAALWRESPLGLLQDGQRLMTMAALLHIDADGKAFLPELISASGLSTRQWLKRYLDVYMSPILHCYYKHSLVFMPHGENLILVMEQHVPVRAIMKDIGEEVCLLNCQRELPEEVRRIAATMNPDTAILSIFTDLFDGIFRYLGAILFEQCRFSDREFWAAVAEGIRSYQAENAALVAHFGEHDLFRPDFHRSCLNRLQLRNNLQMIDLTDPAKNLQFAGVLRNPVSSQ